MIFVVQSLTSHRCIFNWQFSREFPANSMVTYEVMRELNDTNSINNMAHFDTWKPYQTLKLEEIEIWKQANQFLDTKHIKVIPNLGDTCAFGDLKGKNPWELCGKMLFGGHFGDSFWAFVSFLLECCLPLIDIQYSPSFRLWNRITLRWEENIIFCFASQTSSRRSLHSSNAQLQGTHEWDFRKGTSLGAWVHFRRCLGKPTRRMKGRWESLAMTFL